MARPKPPARTKRLVSPKTVRRARIKAIYASRPAAPGTPRPD